MNILSMIIIWCDGSFENDNVYQSIKDEFNETTTATQRKPVDPIDMSIFSDGKEELRSNDVPLITVRTNDDAMHQIKLHKDEKIFIICSGSLGRYLVPEIMRQYPYVHDFYIYTHSIQLHVEWAEEYGRMVKMFNFHTNLLVRLTREISKHFIERGEMYMQIDFPQDALTCFKHARNLEIIANVREKIPVNRDDPESNYPQPDFRDRLDQLEGDNGLICKAENAIRQQEYPFENL